MASDEKRKYTRVPFEVDISLVVGDSIITSKRLSNISLGGMYVYSETYHKEGTQCIVRIDLVGSSSGMYVQAEAEVVRNDSSGMALNFTKIDLDSLIILRHLVEIHSEDSNAVDREYYENLLETDQTPKD